MLGTDAVEGWGTGFRDPGRGGVGSILDFRKQNSLGLV